MNNLTIVIPCKDDPDLLRCIQSIDDSTPTLVVFNGSSDEFVTEMKQELRHLPVTFERLSEANLARALQHGIECAPTDLLLLMDSDCQFRSGSIAAIKHSISRSNPDSSVYKGSIDFSLGRGRISRVIARARHQHTARRLSAYKPPLAFSRRLASRVGGYFFDQRLRWKEDADFDRRVCQGGIEIIPVESCVIEHGALTLRQDLRSNFRYGVGAALAKHLKIDLPAPARSIRETFSNEGWSVAVYMLITNQVRSIGRLTTHLRLALGWERVPAAAR